MTASNSKTISVKNVKDDKKPTNIMVCIRIRPLTKKETEQGEINIIKVHKNMVVVAEQYDMKR